VTERAIVGLFRGDS